MPPGITAEEKEEIIKTILTDATCRSLYSYHPPVFAKRRHQQPPSGWPLSWLLRLLEVLWMLVAVRCFGSDGAVDDAIRAARIFVAIIWQLRFKSAFVRKSASFKKAFPKKAHTSFRPP
ncbi:hypothetical protein PC116_g2209 [Phytophthora cactorum]|uniref:Uncharacterized protein n=1 Tax=Phytophthora cactorum TaxID=29920 RepID=A0A8T1LM92_9STRA|nr:hypothetical protein PC111_g8159 [Phytophthora cactorum]KAG2828548.1 hypothetical protein PC112_g8436 [Phytophthora cactorum]KAG2909193.1 hypothetical protein PC114_g10169 [Phytophthora cactorum]KAG2941989.1 hypothetical protein PC117_g10000 [Phytophthora cactorum]KAG3022728.1 hypothetical protein PC120_g7959 [Phytophthora cactorum]